MYSSTSRTAGAGPNGLGQLAGRPERRLRRFFTGSSPVLHRVFAGSWPVLGSRRRAVVLPPSPPPLRARGAPAPAAAPPAAGRHALVFAGECLPGHAPADVRLRLAVALHLDEARAARLFDGRPVVLRRDVDTATAVRRAARFAELGARLRIDPPPAEAAGPPADAAGPPTRAPGGSPAEAPARLPASTPTSAPNGTVPAEPAPARGVAAAPAPAAATPGAAAPPARPRRVWVGPALGVATVLVGGLVGVALAPHLSHWLWSGAPAAAGPSAGAPVSAAASLPAVTAPAAPALPPPVAAAPPAPAPPVPTPAAPTPAALAPPPPQSAAMPAFVKVMTGEARFEFGGPYSAAPQHRAFAISDDGAHGWVAAVPSENQARAGALERCIRTGPARSGCRVVDVNGVAQE